MNFRLPAKFDEFLSQEIMVTIQEAREWIFEYRRFFVLLGMSNTKLYPSEQIEKVWMIHQSYSRNYFEMSNAVHNVAYFRYPYTGDSSGEVDRANYINTLALY